MVLVLVSGLIDCCLADRFISVDIGYVGTTSSSFGSGPLFGIGVTEGSGKFGFGVTALRFSNTEPVRILGVDHEGKPIYVDFDETVNDFYMTFMVLYFLNEQRSTNHIMLGLGPQVHFVNSSLANQSLKLTARDYRLGLEIGRAHV